MFCISLTRILPIDLKFTPDVSYMVKAHYTRPKLAVQNPFLESKFNDFFYKHLNGVEVQVFSISEFIQP